MIALIITVLQQKLLNRFGPILITNNLSCYEELFILRVHATLKEREVSTVYFKFIDLTVCIVVKLIFVQV